MEQTFEHKRNKLWYALPAIGIAAPVAVMMARRAMAKPEADHGKEKHLLHDTNIGLNRAMHSALKLVPGTPIEVELKEQNGVPVWEVEIVPKMAGPVRQVLIDARNGDLLEMKSES